MASGASLNRGRSEQTVCTPDDFLHAIVKEQFDFDLAATADNSIVPGKFYGPGSDHAENALTAHWDQGRMWCNPPYSNITPWVQKASTVERPNSVVMLVPASVGSNWWRDYVHNRAAVFFLNGRLTFKGHTQPYPKDLALLSYPKDNRSASYSVWNWRTGLHV